MRKLTRKPSLQDTMEANAKALRGLCNLAGKPMPQELEAPDRKPVKPRAERKESDANDLEAAVMREVADVIAQHPNVLIAWRQNSGMSWSENGTPIWFWKWARNGKDKTLTDFMGLLKDGRFWCIECKRRNWTKPSGTREGDQLNFILTVKYAGGVAGFVTSGEQAMELLNGGGK